MIKLEKYSDVLFSTLAEISSLIIAGNDKRLIFQKLLECSLTVLEAERVYLLELESSGIIRYSKSKAADPGSGIKIEALTESPVVRDWMLREGQDQGKHMVDHRLGVRPEDVGDDHVAYRRLGRADDFGTGDRRAQPVEEVDELPIADAGKEVLQAAGEADHFVRIRGAEDHQLIVVVRFVSSHLRSPHSLQCVDSNTSALSCPSLRYVQEGFSTGSRSA